MTHHTRTRRVRSITVEEFKRHASKTPQPRPRLSPNKIVPATARAHRATYLVFSVAAEAHASSRTKCCSCSRARSPPWHRDPEMCPPPLAFSSTPPPPLPPPRVRGFAVARRISEAAGLRQTKDVRRGFPGAGAPRSRACKPELKRGQRLRQRSFLQVFVRQVVTNTHTHVFRRRTHVKTLSL